MKLRSNIIAGILVLGALSSSGSLYAGNEDRAGSAGATELLINPWSRSSAWANAGISSVTGIEAIFNNVAGLAFTEKTDLAFARTNWLGSISNISLNAFGLAQKVGESNVVGIQVMTMNFGNIPITTTESPEGSIGKFKPNYMNFNLAYAKQFSHSISGGINVKIISEAITNVKAQGVGVDAGIRYVTGERDHIKFAISLKNVGPPMSYHGDGLSIQMLNTSTNVNMNVQQRVSAFELPSQLQMGASYDFLFNENNSMVLAGTFTANSFTRDQWRIGADYKLDGGKAIFHLRGGFVYEKDVFNAVNRATALTGPTGGISVEIPAGENKSLLGLDYAFRASVLGGIHTVGVHIDMK